MSTNNIKVTYPITIELDGIDTKSFSGLSKEQIEYVQKQIKEKAIELLTSVNTIPNSALKVVNPYRPEKLPKDKTELEKLYEIERAKREENLMNIQSRLNAEAMNEITLVRNNIGNLYYEMRRLKDIIKEEKNKIRKIRNNIKVEFRKQRRHLRVQEKELKRKFFLDNMNLQIKESNISEIIQSN